MANYSTAQAAGKRAADLATARDTSMYVVRDGEEGYAVASEEELDTFFLGASVVAEVMSDGTCVCSDG